MPVRNNKEDLAPLKEINMMPSTLETVDYALYDWLNEKLDIFATTNKGWKKVPITWVSAERSFQIKKDKNLRDSKGSLKLPIITIERTSIVKDPAQPGIITAHIPPLPGPQGGSITIARRIQQEKTSNFAAADSSRLRGPINSRKVNRGQNYFPKKNSKVVYETITIPIPVYVNITYSIMLRGEYQQQINEMLTPFLTKTGQINYFKIKRDNHSFEGFLPKDFSANNNVTDMGEDERMFETKFDIRILAHLIGQDKNQETPRIAIRENAVQIRFQRERVVTQDEHPDKGGKPSVSLKDRFYKT